MLLWLNATFIKAIVFYDGGVWQAGKREKRVWGVESEDFGRIFRCAKNQAFRSKSSELPMQFLRAFHCNPSVLRRLIGRKTFARRIR
jgi:hypothetical protein